VRQCGYHPANQSYCGEWEEQESSRGRQASLKGFGLIKSNMQAQLGDPDKMLKEDSQRDATGDSHNHNHSHKAQPQYRNHSPQPQ
jgi:hypothetical protein